MGEVTPTSPPVPPTITALSPVPTLTPSPPLLTPTSTPPPEFHGLDVAGIHVYPTPLHVGDQLTVDVVPRLPEGWTEPLTVTLHFPDEGHASAPVGPYAFGGASRARFIWIWTVPQAARLSLTVTLALPSEAVVEAPFVDMLTVTLEPRSAEPLSPPEPEAAWAVAERERFRLHYLTGTAAERDLPTLIESAEAAYLGVTRQLGARDAPPLDVYLLDRVVGQGGYASRGWVAVSYLDRMYAPADLDLLFRHELTHRLDGAIGCDGAPAMLREGLAVFVAGGHYWPESVARKASLLLDTGDYIPLLRLAGDFYLHQHEIGYLEAAAFVTYVVEGWGWETFERLCRAAASAEGTDAERVAAGLETAGLGELEALERDWRRWLGTLRATEQERALFEMELYLLETMRDYQRRYDRGVNFREGVLFDPAEGARREIVADFLRNPRAAEPIALELLLIMAQDALRARAPAEARSFLDTVVAVLEEGFFVSDLALDLLTITEASLEQGYEPYRVECEAAGCFVHALDRAAWPGQVLLYAVEQDGQWRVLGPQPE